MRLAGRVTIGGEVFHHWSRYEVENRGAEQTVTLFLTADAAIDVPDIPVRSEVVAEEARWTGSEYEWIEVARGVTVGRDHVVGRRSEGDRLQLTIDATDARLRRAPTRTYRYQAISSSELLDEVYVKRLGFASVVTNLPEWRVGLFEVTERESWHQAMAGLLAGFNPRTYPGAEDVLYIYDARRPIPEGWPATEIGLKDAITLQKSAPPSSEINRVLMTCYAPGVYMTERELGERAFQDETIEVEADKSPAGHYRARTRLKVRSFFDDPDDPTRVTDEVPLGQIEEAWNGEGQIASRVETTITYLAGTWEQLERRVETEKWARVRLPGGEEDFIQTRHTFREVLYEEDPAKPGTYREIAVYQYEEGEALFPERVPLDEASRERITDESSPRQDSDWVPIEHSHEAVCELRQRLARILTRYDDLLGGVESQTEYTLKGDATETIEPPTVEILIEDRESDLSMLEPPDGIGPRPLVTVDCRAYGERLGREIVEDHIFSGGARRQVTATVALLDADPTRFPGELYLISNRQGADGYWLCESVTQVFARNARPSTSLGLVRCRDG